MCVHAPDIIVYAWCVNKHFACLVLHEKMLFLVLQHPSSLFHHSFHFHHSMLHLHSLKTYPVWINIMNYRVWPYVLHACMKVIVKSSCSEPNIYIPHSSRSMHVYTLLQACMHCISYVCIFSTCSLFRCCISCSFWATCALSSLLVRNCSPAVKDLCLMCLCTLSANCLQNRTDNERGSLVQKECRIGTSNSNFFSTFCHIRYV